MQVEQLGRSFGGVHALQDVSFTLRAGAVHSIIGPNGAGKTTLLNLLTGIYRPSAGRILLREQDLTGARPHRFAAAGLARTFQNLQIFFNMTVLENVMTGRHLREPCSFLGAMLATPARSRAEARCRDSARALLQRVGLAGLEDSPSDGLPYGALKRLEIARALAAEPALLLLDEPAAGLNHTEAQAIDRLIRSLAADGTTVVLVEHNMRLVMEVSDHIIVLDHGRKLAEGTPAQVAADPRVVESYLGVEQPPEPPPARPAGARDA